MTLFTLRACLKSKIIGLNDDKSCILQWYKDSFSPINIGMRYTSDLTPCEWALISYCFPKAATFGRPRQYSYLEIFNGILYVNKTGCQWRKVPKDLPPWASVYHYYRTWKRSGLLPQIQDHLRELVRLESGKEAQADGDHSRQSNHQEQ